MRPLPVLAALAMLSGPLAFGAAADENCPSMFSQSAVPWVSWRDFFRTQPFGTVGFARNGKTAVHVPNPDIACVTLPRHTSSLYVVFNHRNTDETVTGYVSFKVYGLSANTPKTTSLKLLRLGDWTRDKMALPKPFEPPVYQAAYPGRIPAYENFYRDQGPTIGDFDRDFGMLHGVPNGSQEFSWDGRVGMQPDQIPGDRILGYVMHVLARVETQAGVLAPGDPPTMETDQLDYYRDMLVSVSSPLGEGQSRTLRFRE
jgi:hypothetical protein